MYRLPSLRVSPMALVFGLGCATSQGGGGEADAGGESDAVQKAQRYADEATVPAHCRLPKPSQPVRAVDYEQALCPKDSFQAIVARSEREYFAKLACMGSDGAPMPSGIDWRSNELVYVRAWYQGAPGRIVRVLDTDEGRVVQLFQAAYCGGAAPMEGEARWSLLLPRRDAGEVALTGCERQPCGWEANGGPAPP